MVVILMIFHTCGELSFWGVGPILRNEYEIYGQNYVVLLLGSVLCRIVSGKSKCMQVITTGIWCWYLVLKRVAFVCSFVAQWLASDCYKCRRLGGGGFGQRVLFRAAWNIVYVICILLQLNPRVKREYIMDSCLTISHTGLSCLPSSLGCSFWFMSSIVLAL